MDALIVSEETVEGGLKINEERVKRGFGELELVVVDVLGKKENSSSSKLSSTRLRELEAERQTWTKKVGKRTLSMYYPLLLHYK